jgi:Amt family ammonium transporter
LKILKKLKKLKKKFVFSLAFGAGGAVICNAAVRLMQKTKLEDPVDCFAVHGVGGILGCLFTGIFAEKSYAPNIEGGWLDGNYMQIVSMRI